VSPNGRPGKRTHSLNLAWTPFQALLLKVGLVTGQKGPSLMQLNSACHPRLVL